MYSTHKHLGNERPPGRAYAQNFNAQMREIKELYVTSKQIQKFQSLVN